MRRLDGRVAIVSGAGRGLGRAHALRLAAEGASVVVNDVGTSREGVGKDAGPAERLVAEILGEGGRAIASHHDVADWSHAEEMIRLAVDTFGDLHVLVNNAGILRDRTLANMTEDEWDAVIRVHLKGHAAPTRHAMAYWRERARAGYTVNASVIHTTSIAGLAGNFGQANYAAAKAGIIALSSVAALEGARIGVRSNAVSPSARTRMTGDTETGGAEAEFDDLDPANVSPLIAWLAQADCPATGQVFQVYGRRLLVLTVATITHDLAAPGRWTLEALDRELPARTVAPLNVHEFFDRLKAPVPAGPGQRP